MDKFLINHVAEAIANVYEVDYGGSITNINECAECAIDAINSYKKQSADTPESRRIKRKLEQSKTSE